MINHRAAGVLRTPEETEYDDSILTETWGPWDLAMAPAPPRMSYRNFA
jgi:hypothetical protein